MIERRLTFDASAYSVDAVQRAIYRLSDRLSGNVRHSDEVVLCELQLETEDDADADALLADFQKEALDQTLRQRIRDETQEVRNLILALAFSNTGLVRDDNA